MTATATDVVDTLDVYVQTKVDGTNWVDVPGSIATNQVIFALNPTVGSVFYRLLYP